MAIAALIVTLLTQDWANAQWAVMLFALSLIPYESGHCRYKPWVLGAIALTAALILFDHAQTWMPWFQIISAVVVAFVPRLEIKRRSP